MHTLERLGPMESWVRRRKTGMLHGLYFDAALGTGEDEDDLI